MRKTNKILNDSDCWTSDIESSISWKDILSGIGIGSSSSWDKSFLFSESFNCLDYLSLWSEYGDSYLFE